MKRVGIVHRGETRVFVVDSTHIDDEEFKKLIRLEFNLSHADEVALAVAHLDGATAVLPLKQAILDNNATYGLKVYPQRVTVRTIKRSHHTNTRKKKKKKKKHFFFNSRVNV
jgi:hypothetical protein